MRMGRPVVLHSIPQSSWAGLPRQAGAGSLAGLRFSHAGSNAALALPALKRMIRVESLSQSAKALLPPHKCGGFQNINAGASTNNLNKTVHETPRTIFCGSTRSRCTAVWLHGS
jgi:hypothetical protein